jgi:hypothetical protein
LERALEKDTVTITTPSGKSVRCSGEDLLDALIARIDGVDHPLLLLLDEIPPADEELCQLLRALDSPVSGSWPFSSRAGQPALEESVLERVF